MSDAADLSKGNGAGASGGAEAQGSAKVSLPGYVKDNLGKEVYEDWSKRIEKDPEFAKQIPATLPEFAKTWDSGRSQLAEISKKYKEAEEGRKAPNSPQEYAFDEFKPSEGVVYSKQLEDAFRAQAHKLGLTNGAAKGLWGWYNGIIAEQAKIQGEQDKAKEAEFNATRARDLETVRTELRRQWGETFDSRMPRNMAALNNPVMMPQSIAAKLDKSGILRDPVFHLWWDKQVGMMSSDRKLGLNREQGEGLEEDQEKKAPPGRLPEGMFGRTAERYPKRKKAG
jgi:hypothetical protein